MSEPMIEAEALTKRYGELVAVNGVSFRVDRGEILGFLGPNGAGKSTTMRMLTCFFPPTSGSARVNGYDVFSQSLDVRKIIGYLPEGVPLYGEMPVQTYLGFVANLKGVAPGDRAREIDRVVEACALAGVRNRMIAHLSKGYRQRVGLAQALLGDPKVLILDEPTIGLDPTQIVEIRQLIRHLAGERTVILSSHILSEVSMTCSRVLVIHRGTLVADGTPEELSRQSSGAGELVVRVTGPRDAVQAALAAVDGVSSVAVEGGNGTCLYRLATLPERDVRADVARTVVSRDWDLLELAQKEQTLEQIFMRLVAEEREEQAAVDAPPVEPLPEEEEEGDR